MSVNRTHSVIKWLYFALAITAVTSLAIGLSSLRTDHSQETIIVLVPHPDDEFQSWSLIEHRDNQAVIFVTLTQGESSSFCKPHNYETGLEEDLGELPPTPIPTGTETKSCTAARMNSMLGFISEMSLSDPHLPGNFLPATHHKVPGTSSHTASIWRDKDSRGAVVAFDLDDGNVTSEQVITLTQELLSNQQNWQLDYGKISAIVGSFANDSYRCYSYPHPDHLAVSDALWSHDFGVGPQLAAGCITDPETSLIAMVSNKSSRAAFNFGSNWHRLGAHERHYGWLHNESYELAETGQGKLFTRFQAFWIRFD